MSGMADNAGKTNGTAGADILRQSGKVEPSLGEVVKVSYCTRKTIRGYSGNCNGPHSLVCGDTQGRLKTCEPPATSTVPPYAARRDIEGTCMYLYSRKTLPAVAVGFWRGEMVILYAVRLLCCCTELAGLTRPGRQSAASGFFVDTGRGTTRQALGRPYITPVDTHIRSRAHARVVIGLNSGEEQRETLLGLARVQSDESARS